MGMLLDLARRARVEQHEQAVTTKTTLTTKAVTEAKAADDINGKCSEESEAATDPAATSEHWWLHFAGREPAQMACSPAMTHGEVLAANPRAIAAEPFEPVRRQPSTALTAELHRLANHIADFHGFTAAQRAEALTIAFADPEDALTCFRALACEIPGKGHQ
ncbi:MAG: hypothetical protein ACKVQA_03300 [Burkholderiales bacterium]